MQRYLVGGVDWQPKWVRAVVCADTGTELARAVWPRDEAADCIPGYFDHQRDIHGAPLLVAGRCQDNWPNELLETLFKKGFPVELYDGAPLGRLLRLERRWREDQRFRGAALLAAVHKARQQNQGVGDLDTFVLEWSVQQTRERLDQLAVELESLQPQWFEDGTENLGPWKSLRPAIFSELVRMSVLPYRPETVRAPLAAARVSQSARTGRHDLEAGPDDPLKEERF